MAARAAPAPRSSDPTTDVVSRAPTTHVAAPSSPAKTAVTAAAGFVRHAIAMPTDTRTVATPGTQVMPTRNIAAIR